MCNKNGGWSEDMHSGGSCVLGCPGAVSEGKKGKCPLTRVNSEGTTVPNTECDAAGRKERDAVCNGAGLPWPLGTSVADSLGGDMNTHRKARGCFVRSEDRSQSNDGPDSVCFYCDDRRGASAAARKRAAGEGDVGPSCAVVDRREGSKVWRRKDGGYSNNPDSNTKTARAGNVFSEAFSCACPAGGKTRNSRSNRNLNMKVYYNTYDQCFPASSFGDYSRRFWTRWSDYVAARRSTSYRCGSEHNWTTRSKSCW
jgi:hypothetical protein